MDLPVTLLSEIPLFQTLPTSEFHWLSGKLRLITLPAGEVLFREGETGQFFYIIIEGQIEVIKAFETPNERLLAVRGRGEYFGEMGLVALEHQRTATIRAREGSQLLELSQADFDELLHRYPDLAYKMVEVLSERLNSSHNNALHDLEEKNEQLRKAYDELKDAQEKLVEKERLERELQVARNIQLSLLPSEMPSFAGYQFGAGFLPMMAVGGDFYDFIPLGDHRIGMCLGDVSGHGVPAALFMALTVALIRSAACSDCSPEQVLSSVNRHLIEFNHEGMFVTLLYGVLSSDTGEFNYSRAGHEPPILCRADGTIVTQEILPGPFLGFFPDSQFAAQTQSLRAGDLLMMYTDGVSEAKNEQGVMFEDERVREIVAAHRQSSAQELCEQVLEQVTGYFLPSAQKDDITVICLKAE